MKKREALVDGVQVNAAALCLHALSYNLLNTFRSLSGASDFIDEPAELSLRRARRLLLVPGRIVRSARTATLIIMIDSLAAWQRAWARISALHPPPDVA